MVFKTFSCWPSNPNLDAPRQPCTLAQVSLHQTNEHRREQEKQRRIAWVEGCEIHSRAMGGPVPAGTKAAPTKATVTAATAASKKVAAAAMPQAAVGTS